MQDHMMNSEILIKNKFNDSPYQVVVFDGIFLLDMNMLTKIKHYIEKRPNKIVLATGDTAQNGPIDTLTNTQEPSDYAMHCVTLMFPNFIKLIENKRLNNEADKEKLKNLKK